MKTLLALATLVALLFGFGSSTAHAQSAIKWVMPLHSESFTSGTDAPFTGTIKNTTDSTVIITFRRWQNLPPDWSTSVCFGSLCYADFIDTSSEAFAPGEEREFILHVFAPEGNSDSVRAYIRLSGITGNPADTVGMEFDATTASTEAVAPASIDGALAIESVYPNPITGNSKLSVGYVSSPGSSVHFTLIDLLGHSRTIGHQTTLSSEMQSGAVAEMPLADVVAGFYMLVVESSSGERVSYPLQILSR